MNQQMLSPQVNSLRPEQMYPESGDFAYLNQPPPARALLERLDMADQAIRSALEGIHRAEAVSAAANAAIAAHQERKNRSNDQYGTVETITDVLADPMAPLNRMTPTERLRMADLLGENRMIELTHNDSVGSTDWLEVVANDIAHEASRQDPDLNYEDLTYEDLIFDEFGNIVSGGESSVNHAAEVAQVAPVAGELAITEEIAPPATQNSAFDAHLQRMADEARAKIDKQYGLAA